MKYLIALAAALVVGCTTLGVPVPQTFNQKALVAYSGATSLVTTVTNLDAAGVVTDADAKNVAAQADNVKAGIEIARQAEAAVAGSGTTKLDAAIAVLTAAQTYLCSKQPKGTGGCPMDAVEILNEVLALIQAAAALGQELQEAQSAGVDITKEQLNTASAEYTAARQRLDDLIASHGK